MFDELFGEKAKKAAAVDTYLERMEKILTIKKMALELSEGNLSDTMSSFLESIAHAAQDLFKEDATEKKEEDSI